MRVTRIRASPRHGGAVRCLQICLQALIRRRGAPSGAAGFIGFHLCRRLLQALRLMGLLARDALLPVFLIRRELDEGRLVPAFGGPVRALGSYYLVWPHRTAPRAPLVSFRRWLERDIAA